MNPKWVLIDMVPLQHVLLRKQPLFSGLICGLRGLSDLTQEKFAAAIGVRYVTVGHWEAGQIQFSELALRQVHAFLEQLSLSNAYLVQERAKELLTLYLAPMQR